MSPTMPESEPTKREIEEALVAVWRQNGGWPAVESGMVNMVGLMADRIALLYANQRTESPRGFKWKLVPDYPAGEVVGACICGSWPGGECLRCPPLTTEEAETK